MARPSSVSLPALEIWLEGSGDLGWEPLCERLAEAVVRFRAAAGGLLPGSGR